MAINNQQTDSYANLIALIEAYAGADFIAVELTRIKALINARARAAYREHELWENTLFSEWVTINVDGGYIAYQEFIQQIGGTTVTSRAESIGGKIDTPLRAHDQAVWTATGRIREWDYFCDQNGVNIKGYQPIYAQAQDTFNSAATTAGAVSINIDGLMDCVTGAKVKVEGFDDTTVDINGEHDVTGDPGPAALLLGNTQVIFNIADTTNHTFSLTGNEQVSVSSVYLTYKRELHRRNKSSFGDGGGTEDSEIPEEWFEYLALGTYADMLAADGFHEKSLAWETRANKALERELERVDALRAHMFARQKIRNHSTEQLRQTSTL